MVLSQVTLVGESFGGCLALRVAHPIEGNSSVNSKGVVLGLVSGDIRGGELRWLLGTVGSVKGAAPGCQAGISQYLGRFERSCRFESSRLWSCLR